MHTYRKRKGKQHTWKVAKEELRRPQDCFPLEEVHEPLSPDRILNF